MGRLSRTLGHHQQDFERQLMQLRRELAGLQRTAGGATTALRDDAAEFGEALWRGGVAAARGLRKSARQAGRAVRRDPAPAVALAVAAACILTLALSRK